MYVEPPSVRPDGRVRNGRWRATYRDEQGQIRRVAAPTRAEAERRRDERLAEIAERTPSSTQFSRETTVSELVTWWLESIARHQVKTSTFDSYRRFGRYLMNDIGSLAVVEVGPETLVTWQSDQLDRYAPLPF